MQLTVQQNMGFELTKKPGPHFCNVNIEDDVTTNLQRLKCAQLLQNTGCENSPVTSTFTFSGSAHSKCNDVIAI